MNLFNKVWDLHKIRTLPNGQDQLFIGLHLIHEVTSPQAFQMLRDRGLSVKYPDRTFATMDHIVPTGELQRPFRDEQAETMTLELEKNTAEHGIQFFSLKTDYQGIVHIIGPELGLTQPGMTIACGDSHTSTHGAFGAVAFGIGTSQIRDILASQCLSINRPKVRRITIKNSLAKGVYAKDIILAIIGRLTVKGGIGYAYEYGGSAIEELSMEGRMTICNMSIEGGARAGYINPDQTTFDYIKGRMYAPKGQDFEKAQAFWQSLASGKDARYDDEVVFDGAELEPMVTWGITPGQCMPISQKIPTLESLPESEREVAEKAQKHTGWLPNERMLHKKINVAFLGSCTNGRISDLREAASIVQGNKVHKDVKAFVVPGSKQVSKQAEKEGLDAIFRAAGFDWRGAGCSMCLGMNPDKLVGREICASSSNRNFIGRQGSPSGRTVLMSPAMVASAAIAGEIVDIRDFK